jgi:hypothetical protein
MLTVWTNQSESGRYSIVYHSILAQPIPKRIVLVCHRLGGTAAARSLLFASACIPDAQCSALNTQWTQQLISTLFLSHVECKADPGITSMIWEIHQQNDLHAINDNASKQQ